MPRNPDPVRYDSKTFGSKLQLRVLPGFRRPSLKTKDEAALLGGVSLATDIKENRLHIKKLEEENVQPTQALTEIWPAGLYGISVPGHVDVIQSQQMQKRPIGLPAALLHIKGGTKGLVHSLTIELGDKVDPDELCSMVAERWGAAAAERIRPEWIDKRLQAAIKDGKIIDPDGLFTERPWSKQFLITLYGPDGQEIKSADELGD